MRHSTAMSMTLIDACLGAASGARLSANRTGICGQMAYRADQTGAPAYRLLVHRLAHSTLEEPYPTRKPHAGLGSDNIDYRLRNAEWTVSRRALAGMFHCILDFFASSFGYRFQFAQRPSTFCSACASKLRARVQSCRLLIRLHVIGPCPSPTPCCTWCMDQAQLGRNQS